MVEGKAELLIVSTKSLLLDGTVLASEGCFMMQPSLLWASSRSLDTGSEQAREEVYSGMAGKRHQLGI